MTNIEDPKSLSVLPLSFSFPFLFVSVVFIEGLPAHASHNDGFVYMSAPLFTFMLIPQTSGIHRERKRERDGTFSTKKFACDFLRGRR